MNFIDKLINYVWPTWAVSREQARFELRSFSGAEVSKLRPGWTRVAQDADTAILNSLPVLRARCNNLVENDALVAGVIDDYVKNVLGNGLIPQFDPADRDAELVLLEWLSTPRIIDYTGVDDFFDICETCFRNWLIDGEFFLRICPNGQLELIDPARIWHSSTEHLGNEIRGGVELDKRGRHLAFWVGPHPGAYRVKDHSFIRIPAVDMVHGYIRKRPNQTRGYPIFAPILNQLRDLGEMGKASLVSARIAACVGLIIQQQRHGVPSTNDAGDSIDHIYPGMIKRLRPGETVSSLDPKQPGAQFAPFVAYNHRSIATALNLSYETVSRDMSQGNFSSARLAKISENATFKRWQNKIIKKFCKPVVDAIQSYLYLTGRQSQIYNITWQTPGFAWVDPEKDVAANILAIKENIKSKRAVIAESGGNIDDIYKLRAVEIAAEQKLGINNGESTTLSNTGKITP